MLEAQKASVIDIDANVSPIVLAGILGINVSLLYQNAQAGIIPADFINYSYRDILQQYIRYYKKAEGVKLAKLEAEKEVKLAKATAPKKNYGSYDDEEGDDSIRPLMAAKLKQSVKTERARESQLWQAIAIKKLEYVNFNEKLALIEPFILHIKDLLLGVAIDYPETQTIIDEGMESLFNLGTRLIEEVEEDKNNFIQAMLDREIEDD